MNDKVYRILLINPGSTSTKVAYYENEECVITRSIFHDSKVLKQMGTINDQLAYRMFVVRKFIFDTRIPLKGLDAVVGRGGPCASCKSGTYEISDLMVKDTREMKGHYYHASMLGVQMADQVRKMFYCRAFAVDPPVVDELCDEARITGVKNIYKRAGFHVLNSKETGRQYAASIGKRYEDLNLIIAHIDGGVSITAHKHGRMIDGNDTGGGEGPLTPTRMGSFAVTDYLDYLEGRELKEIRNLCSVTGGFSSWFDTSDLPKIYYEKVRRNDPEARRVYEAMLYQIQKWICMMAGALKGQVDAVLLTGGLLRIPDLVRTIEEGVSWIAPVTAYPGEFENEAMVNGALRILRGEEVPMTYTGIPVWQGFDESDERGGSDENSIKPSNKKVSEQK